MSPPVLLAALASVCYFSSPFSKQSIPKTFQENMPFVLAEELVARGYDVRLTRTGDYAVSIPDRRAQAEADAAGLFISLHMNRGDDEQENSIKLYANLDNPSAVLATEHVAKHLWLSPFQKTLKNN